MAQQFRETSATVEEPGIVPRWLTTSRTPEYPVHSSGLLEQHACRTHIYMQTKSLIHKH